MTFDSFDEMVRRATSGNTPYPYQRRLAADGLPEVLAVPTGTGKTMAAVLPWLYRRRYHPAVDVRRATPRRLVYVVPMRTLVEQSVENIRQWLGALGLSESVQCHVLMGGEPRLAPWRITPEADAILVGTLDMVVSRALNRGYGESRYLWPIDFGLLNADCQYVYDEIQLMGPALATSRQLHGLRQKLGTAMPCGSMWMSATVDESKLSTFDAPTFGEALSLSDDDWADVALATRLRAAKRIIPIDTGHWSKYDSELAERTVSAHRPGTLTILIVNTVDRAADVHRAIARLQPAADTVLVHSRFRPADRQSVVDQVKAAVDPSGPGRIVVSTQVIEAGLDVSASTLITEAAPWPSIVQRAGRCNRDGEVVDAQLLWLRPPRPEPYPPADLEATAQALASLEGVDVTSQSLREIAVAVTEEIQPTLRRRDLLDLFDTMPDLSGNDVDIARFIRDSADLDVFVAWRADWPPSSPSASQTMPGKDERCAVPVAKFREWLKRPRKEHRGVWRWDHLRARWVDCAPADLRPGMVVVVDSRLGGYDPVLGWAPGSTEWVDPVIHGEPAADDQSTEDDPATTDGEFWVTLRDHLADTERQARRLVEQLQPSGLSPSHLAALVDAARLHDIGKAHPIFRESVRNTVGEGQVVPPEHLVLAKSAGSRPLRHGVRNFRHELASALALLGEGQVALEGVDEKDLAVYLVAAHHGRVRVGLRSLPGDERPSNASAVLGVEDGQVLPAVDLPGGELPATVLDLSYIGLGRRDGRRSWSERSLALRDRPDIGPFRLGFMEALVRLADWAASADPTVWHSESETNHG